MKRISLLARLALIVSSVLALGAAPTAQARPTEATTAGQPAAARSTAAEKVLDEWAARWSSTQEVDRLLDLFTDDIIYEDAALGVVNHGKLELREFAMGFFMSTPDAKFELVSRFASGNLGSMEWILTGTDTGDTPERPALGLASASASHEAC
jgi:ketosteroid isomerase-like protein